MRTSPIQAVSQGTKIFRSKCDLKQIPQPRRPRLTPPKSHVAQRRFPSVPLPPDRAAHSDPRVNSFPSPPWPASPPIRHRSSSPRSCRLRPANLLRSRDRAARFHPRCPPTSPPPAVSSAKLSASQPPPVHSVPATVPP